MRQGQCFAAPKVRMKEIADVMPSRLGAFCPELARALHVRALIFGIFLFEDHHESDYPKIFQIS